MFGTFDILHPGHAALFKQARKKNSIITVILARDRTVKQLKKHLPMFSERVRKRNLEKTGWVENVLLGSLKDKYQALKKIKPDIIYLGYDQKYFVSELSKKLKLLNLKTQILRLKPFKPYTYKSSIIKRYVRHKIHQGKSRTSKKQQRVA